MSTPSGYASWATGRGLNPYHPDTWSAADRAAYMRWKLDTFRARAHRWAHDGTAAAFHASGAKGLLIRSLRFGLELALEPAPARNPWQVCPCHPRRLGGMPSDKGLQPWQHPTPDAALAWAERNERLDASRRHAGAMAFLESFAPGSHGEGGDIPRAKV